MRAGGNALDFLSGKASNHPQGLCEMEFLEDVLKRYGITADYWPADESVPAPEGRVDNDALLRPHARRKRSPERFKRRPNGSAQVKEPFRSV